jgi:hypothetical protein
VLFIRLFGAVFGGYGVQFSQIPFEKNLNVNIKKKNLNVNIKKKSYGLKNYSDLNKISR